MTTHIVIIEDDKDLAQFLSQVLADHGFESTICHSGVKGLEVIEQREPNMVLLDLKLPDISGEVVCEKVKSLYPHMAVIMITAKDSPQDLARGLSLGADDYIGKPIEVDELIARIKARLRTAQSVNQTFEVDTLSVNVSTHEVSRAGEKIELSAQEFKLLEFLIQNPDRVLSRDVILTRIWGMVPDVETRVVDVYIGYLRKKIDKGHDVKLIQSVRGFGYMLKKPKAK